MSHRQRRSSSAHGRRPSGAMIAAGGGLATSVVLLSGSTAQAIFLPTVTVKSLGDSSLASPTIVPDETLADAIAYIDNSANGGYIVFKSGLSGTIHLTSPLPTIDKPVQLYGPGATQLTIDGGGTSVGQTTIRIASGLTKQSVISGLTLIHGHGTNGGAISALSGVGIYDDRILHNAATATGGGVYTTNGSPRIQRSTIAYNSAVTGSAVRAEQGTDSSAGTSIGYSTISGNRASGGFGALDIQTDLSITTSTISGNTSVSHGGGIYVRGAADLTGSTVANNTSGAAGGGGVFVEPGSSSLNVFSSIVADNHSTGSPFRDIYNGATNSNVRYSLIGDTDTHSALTLYSNDIFGTGAKPAQPKLSKLGFFGGPTKTMEPLQGSPVINKGSAGFSQADQRGYGRPVVIPGIKLVRNGDGSDIGAVEVQAYGESASTQVGNLKLSLSLPVSSCVASFDNLPASFRAAVQKHSKATRYHFKSVSFYLDPGAHSSQRPAAVSKRTSSHPVLPLTGRSGEHTLTAVVTVTHRVKRHHHKHTVKGHAKLRLDFDICGTGFVI